VNPWRKESGNSPPGLAAACCLPVPAAGTVPPSATLLLLFALFWMHLRSALASGRPFMGTRSPCQTTCSQGLLGASCTTKALLTSPTGAGCAEGWERGVRQDELGGHAAPN